MSEPIMDRAAAGRFVEAWCANWRKVDIDAVVAHFAEDAEMRSPWRSIDRACDRRRREHPRLLAAGLRKHRERRSENPELELGRGDRAVTVWWHWATRVPASSWTLTVRPRGA